MESIFNEEITSQLLTVILFLFSVLLQSYF